MKIKMNTINNISGWAGLLLFLASLGLAVVMGCESWFPIYVFLASQFFAIFYVIGLIIQVEKHDVK